MTIVGHAQKSGLLITTTTIRNVSMPQTTVILDMGSKRRFLAQLKLARNLSVDATCHLTSQVKVEEVVPRAPFVSFEMFYG